MKCKFEGYLSGDTKLRCGRQVGSPICEKKGCELIEAVLTEEMPIPNVKTTTVLTEKTEKKATKKDGNSDS